MLTQDAKWHGNAGAGEGDLDRLRHVAAVPLPAEYLAFLAFSDGGEGPLGVDPGCVIIDSAGDAASQKENKAFEEFFPGFFMFGGNGAGELLAFDVRGSMPWPVVMIDMTNINLEESVVKIADNFSCLLEHIGRE
jgi:hypothetical protein